MSNRHFLTLGQAAKLAEVAKSTITRAIEKGQLSAAERVGNSYRIDPAELQRWQDTRVASHPYPAPKQPSATGGETLSLHVRNAQLEAEIQALKAAHAAMESANAELKAMTEKMMAAKDKEIERLYTLAITDQRERSRRGMLGRLFRRNAGNTAA